MTYAQQVKTLESMAIPELENVIKLAIGRVLRMVSRATQAGDIEEYDRVSFIAVRANEIIKERRNRAGDY